MDRLKEKIQSVPELKMAVILRKIGWNEGNFSHWMSGRRGIPKAKEKALIAELKRVGESLTEIEDE